jgi:hypothetical protein
VINLMVSPSVESGMELPIKQFQGLRLHGNWRLTIPL